MDAAKAIEILKRQRALIPPLRPRPMDSPDFVKWKRDTEVALTNIFTADKRHLSDFRGISYVSAVTFTGDERDGHSVFVAGLGKAEAILSSFIDEISEYPSVLGMPKSVDIDKLSLVEQICLKFQTAAQILQDRRADRPSIEINDEYDVQDLLHAFLRLHFEDVRPEEFAPSHAGGNSRVDFLLKNERILIEVKKTRQGLKAKDLGEQLIIDRARYETHPACDTLICFVYDPEKRISNPVGIKNDIENHGGRLKVLVIFAP